MTKWDKMPHEKVAAQLGLDPKYRKLSVVGFLSRVGMSPPPQLGYYTFAACVVVAATFLRHLLTPHVGFSLTYITFYPAVMLVATVAGTRPGIFATVLSAACADYFFLVPAGTLGTYRDHKFGDLLGLAVFLFMGVAVSLLAGKLKFTREKSEQRLRQILEAGPEGLAVVNRAGHIVFANQKLEKLFGYSHDEFIGMPIQNLVPARFRQIHARGLESFFSSPKPSLLEFGLEAVGLRQDGTEFPTNITLGLMDSDLRLLACCTIRDITEKKKGIDLLKTTEERLRLALTAGKMGVWEVNWKTHQVWRSVEHDQIYGYDSLQPEWTLEKSLGHILPQDKDIANRALEEAARNGTLEVKCRIQRKDDVIRWIEVEGVVYKDARGAPSRMMGTVADITDRRAAEMETEQRADLLNLAHDAILVRDADGRITFWSRGAEELYGWSSKEAVGQLGDELLRTELPVSITEVMTSVVKRGRWDGELMHVAKDGRKILVDSRWSLKNGVKGIPVAVLEINRDITNVRKGEEALRLNSTISANMAEGACLIRAKDGIILYANPQFDELFGYDRGELQGKQISVVNAPAEKTPEEISEEIASTLHKTGFWRGEIQNIKKDGTRIWTQATASTFQHANYGEIWVTVQTDINARKSAERKAASLQAESTADLGALTALQQLSTRIISTVELEQLMKEILEGVISIQNADFGILQLVNSKANELQIVAHKGVSQAFVNHFGVVQTSDEAAPCGRAYKRRGRVMIEDVSMDPGYTPYREFAAAEGFRAVQSTPLFSRAGEIVGVVTTHFRAPRRPSDRELRLTDLYAAQAAEMVERKRAEEIIKMSEQRLKLALDSGQMGIWELDLISDTTVRNLRHDQIFGYESMQPEWGYKVFLTHVLSGDRDAIKKQFESSASTDDFFFECRILWPDESIHWISAQGRVFPNDEGQPAKMIGTLVDVTERKQAEELIRQASAYSRGLIEVSLDPLVTIARDGKIQDVNRATEEVTGVTREKLIGTDFSGYFTEPGNARSAYEIAFAQGSMWECPLVIRHTSGRLTDVLYNAAVYKNENGEVAGVFAAARDISDRKRAEAEWKLAFDTVSDSVLLLDNQFRIQRANRATAEILGVPGVELVGQHCHEVFHLLDSPPSGCPMQRMLLSGVEERCDLPEPTLGKIFDVTATPLKDAAGIVQGCVHVVRDITERKQTEERQRSASLYARGLIEASLDPLVTIDAEGKIRDVNRATELVTGMPRKVLIGSEFSRYFTEPDKARQGYQMAFSQGTVWDYPLVLRHASGKLTDVLYNASIYKNEKGEVEGVFAAARDVSELKALEKQLRQSQKMEAIGQLAGGIAHDFNNIMAIILGYSEIAQEHVPPSDPLSKQLSGIQKAALRAAALTNQLLAFGRKQVLQPVLSDLNRNLDSVTEILTRVIGENIELVVEHAENLPLVKVDPMQIEQVLINLALNARDAMPQGGKLVIKTSSAELDAEYCRHAPEVLPGKYDLIAVSDNGVGMTPDTQAHIFEPFFTTKGLGKGTGLGLSIIYGVIKQSGGHISVTSKVGHGTTFKIYLPQSIPQVSKSETWEHEGLAAIKQRSSTILLVEDEPDLLEMMRQTFEASGYTVLRATSAEEALRMAENFEGKIDLLLTDIILKTGMDGTILAERLKGLRPEVKIIFISGYNDVLLTTANQEGQDAAFLSKPFSTGLLRRKVREILKSGDQETSEQAASETSEESV